MSRLNEEQLQLIFDYSLEIGTPQESKMAEQIISSNPEAAKIYQDLRSALSPLDSLQSDQTQLCPDYLARKTIARLCAKAQELEPADQSHIQLQELLSNEQAQTVTHQSGFWRNFGRVLSAAAVFMIVAGIASPTLKFAKQMHQQTRCQAQLAQIGQGVLSYKQDHGNMLPQVAVAEGTPWWHVADQNQASHSNTRHIWVLVKDNYVDPVHFICPGRKDIRIVKLTPGDIIKLRDFPSRQNITYSMQLMNDRFQRNANNSSILMADLNPLFETLPANSNVLNVKLNNELMMSNSANHNRRGQNVLFCDGAVRFVKTRKMDVTNDDIFTLKNTSFYKGIETPNDSDSFLAP